MASLQDGPGVAPDRNAAESGDASAQYAMGLRYVNGLGVPQHYGMALGWFLDAAEQNHAGAQYMVGVAYAVGRGVDKDLEEAFGWFSKAGVLGHVRALYQVGDAYANGRGVPKSIPKAAEWLKKSAELWYPDAQFDLGIMLVRGLGSIPVNEPEGLKWLILAAQGGHKLAPKVLKALEGDVSKKAMTEGKRRADAWALKS